MSDDLFAPSPRSQLANAQSGTSSTRSSVGQRLQRLGVALLIIAVTGLAGYLLSSSLSPTSESPTTDLLQLSAQRAEAVQLNLQTSNPSEAEQFVQKQLGRRLAVPRIDGATLSGVSIVEIDPDVQVPVFIFADDSSGQRFTTYAYTYALLDRLDERVQLAQEMRRQLQDEERITLQTLGENGILTWRKHDDIYVTVTETDPRQVRPRIAHSP